MTSANIHTKKSREGWGWGAEKGKREKVGSEKQARNLGVCRGWDHFELYYCTLCFASREQCGLIGEFRRERCVSDCDPPNQRLGLCISQHAKRCGDEKWGAPQRGFRWRGLMRYLPTERRYSTQPASYLARGNI